MRHSLTSSHISQADCETIEAERDALLRRLNDLLDKHKGSDQLSDRVKQLEATQGQLVVQHGIDAHDLDHRMQVISNIDSASKKSSPCSPLLDVVFLRSWSGRA